MNPLCFRIVNLQCIHSLHENYMLRCQNKENIGPYGMYTIFEIKIFRIFLKGLIIK